MIDYQEYDEWAKSLPSGSRPRGKWRKEYNEQFDCVKGEILRVACGFTRDKQYVLLINMKGRVRYKRWYHHWGDEIIAHYEEIK